MWYVNTLYSCLHRTFIPGKSLSKSLLKSTTTRPQNGPAGPAETSSLMCGNSHGGTHSHLSHKIALVKLYEDKMNWPRFPKLFFFLFELSLTKSTQKKSKKYSPLLACSFSSPPFLPPPPLLWLNYQGNKKGMLDWRETSYSHPYHKVQRELWCPRPLTCGMFTVQLIKAIYSCFLSVMPLKNGIKQKGT